MTPVQAPAKDSYSIVFFDGHCHLCNGWVNFLLRRKNKNRFRFAPLQGSAAREILNLPAGQIPETILYFRQKRLHQQSDAVLHIFHDLGGAWKLMWFFAIIPGFIRNYFYRIIARNRYRWFGKAETCRMPEPGERALFLD